MKKVIVFGASGHAKVVVDVLRLDGRFEVAGLVDRSLPKGASFFGLPVLGSDSDIRGLASLGLSAGIVAIGDNSLRSRVVTEVLNAVPDFEFVNVVHPRATVAGSARIGSGTVVMAGVVINSDATIGKHCIINTGANLDHDNVLGDFVSVAPGAVTGGSVTLNDFSVLSIHACVIHGRSLGRGAVVGAGSVVTRDIPELVVAYGVPASVVRSRTIQEKYL